MTTLGAIAGSIPDLAGAAAPEADEGKEQAAAFRKELTRTALSMASNWVMEAQDIMADLEDDDDEK